MQLIIIPLVVWLSAQLFKFFHRSWQRKRYTWSNFLDYGGMPSTHTVLVSSFTTMVSLDQGWQSPLFGFCLIFAVFIIHDALRLRNIIQIQSKLLNHLRLRLPHDQQSAYPVISERVGHKLSEVIVGVIVGVALTFIVHYIA